MFSILRASSSWTSWVALFLLTRSPVPGGSDEGVPVLELHALHDRLCRSDPEAWEKVPFRTDLLEAREEAARTGRPLFLWSMNGHPLGCT